MTNSAGARLYGTISASVLAYRLAGRSLVTVDSSAAPYVIRGNSYSNSHLSLRMSKPTDFVFTALDETWPSMTVVAVAHAHGDTVRVESRYRDPWFTADEDARRRAAADSSSGPLTRVQAAGRSAWLRSGRRDAVIAMPNGGETLILRATGADATALVQRAASWLTLTKTHDGATRR
jgi:hypothetical protein